MTDKEAFKEKLKSIQWGVVPGGYRSTNSQSYYDKDSLPDLPSKEEVMDNRSDYANAPTKEVPIESLSEH